MDEKIVAVRDALIGEIETLDIYHIRKMDDMVSINDANHVHVKGHNRKFSFEPKLVIDLGANIGVFSRYAKRLYPKAAVIAVEPDRDNVKHFKELGTEGIKLIRAGIGKGFLFRGRNADNGTKEVYLSRTKEYTREELEENFDRTFVPMVMLDNFEIPEHTILKIDIEGNETTIFEDEASMEVLRKCDYIAGELHFFAPTHEGVLRVKEITRKALATLTDHKVEYDHLMFYATRKKYYVQKDL